MGNKKREEKVPQFVTLNITTGKKGKNLIHVDQQTVNFSDIGNMLGGLVRL